MNVALKAGGVSLAVQLGTGKLDTTIKPKEVRFDDNEWHHVKVKRKNSQVSRVGDCARAAIGSECAWKAFTKDLDSC
jgi:hypothetical protein